VAALPPQQSSQPRQPSADAREWEKVKDSSDAAALQKFVSRFPDSPLALDAQRRIDALKRAVREREEAAQKAKVAAAAAAAQKKRDEDERRAAAAEAERKAKEAEAARKAEDARQKASQVDRQKAEAEAAAARAAADKQAQAAEAARKQAESGVAMESTCQDQETKLDAILAKGSEGTGLDDLKNFAATVTCERLQPLTVVALDRFKAEAGQREAAQPNSLELVRVAQTELIRLGCFTGKPDGALASTQTALGRYLSILGLPTKNPTVTQDLITELGKRTTRVCPPECDAGEILKGGTCVADRKPTEASSPKSRREGRETRREKEKPAQEKPRQQAQARPSVTSGRGGKSGGGGGGMMGVGF
jgi:hypothetical protein